MNDLRDIGERLRTQDNRATDAPIFVVQQKVRDFGYDRDSAEGSAWLNESNDYEEADEAKAMECELACEKGEDTSPWVKYCYKDRWEFVTTCFTARGCRDYINQNGHNLNEPRIYAESSYRNDEFRRVREALIGEHWSWMQENLISVHRTEAGISIRVAGGDDGGPKDTGAFDTLMDAVDAAMNGEAW